MVLVKNPRACRGAGVFLPELKVTSKEAFMADSRQLVDRELELALANL